MTTLSWHDFDPEVVASLKKGRPGVVDTSSTGGMRCPLVGHAHELGWQRNDYKLGTRPCGHPPVRFRVTATYVLEDPLDNFIVGHELVSHGLASEWGKAETGRLGNENSEDAVSWNVFRSLQEAAALREIAREVFEINAPTEPRLMLWGRELLQGRTREVPELKRALDAIEPGLRQQTEPDIVLHWPGELWLFLEAKLASRTATYRHDADVSRWRARYCAALPRPFRRGRRQLGHSKELPATASAQRRPGRQGE